MESNGFSKAIKHQNKMPLFTLRYLPMGKISSAVLLP
jgi:hypothetical protein